MPGFYTHRHPILQAILLILLAALSLLSPARSGAQRFPTDTFAEVDGLPSATVRTILRTTDGRLWVATRAGLVAYDGVEWTVQTIADGLPDNDLSVLAEGRGGGIWAASTSGGRIARRAPGGEWRPLPPAQGAYLPLAIAELSCNRELCLALATREGFYLWSDGRWRGPPHGLPATSIYGLATLGTRLLVATVDGLAELAEDHLVPLKIPGLPAGGIFALVRHEDTLWLAGESDQGQGWIANLPAKHRLGAFQLLADDLTLPPRSRGTPWALTIDGFGGALIGSRFGLLHVHPVTGVQTLGTATGLAADGVTALLHDSENLLWVATLRGLSRISSLRFASLDRAHGLLEDEVSAALQLRDGSIVLGHNRGLTFQSLGDTSRTLPFQAPSDAMPGDLRVLDMEEDPAGGLWIAGSTLGLGYLKAPDVPEQPPQVVRWERPADEPSTTSVRVDRRGKVWVSGDRGLYELIDSRMVLAPNTPRASIRRLILGASGKLYAASNTGLFIGEPVSAGSRDFVAANAPANAANIFAVLEAADGTAWVGTRAGLFRLVGKTIERSAEPLVERPVYSLLHDASGQLWIGTDNGAERWDGQALRRYTLHDGLSGGESNRAAAFLDRQDRVWIGTDRGISIYREIFDRPAAAPPTPALVGVEAGGIRHSLQGTLTLDPSDNDLTFHFRARTLRDPGRLRFRSRLEGYEQGWLPPFRAPQQSQRYTNLPPGTYRFHLETAWDDGAWSAVASTPPVVLRPPFWRRPWFLFGTLVLAVALLALLVRTTAQRRYASRLRDEVRQRTAELDVERSRLVATLDSIVEGVAAVANDGTVLRLNPSAEELTGWTQAEAEGRPLAEVLPLVSRDAGSEVTPDAAPNLADEILAAGCATVLQRLFQLQRGSRSLSLEVSGAPIREGERITGVVLAFRDVTDRQRLERDALKAQKLEALGLLAGGIAHDFNNLLTTILGHLELVGGEVEAAAAEGLVQSSDKRPRLEETQDTAANGEELETTHAGLGQRIEMSRQAAQRARGLTQRLLTFARGGEPIRRATDLATLVRAAAEHTLEDTTIRWRFSLPEDLWPVDIDSGQIHEVLGNIFRNAAQAMPDGGEIKITAVNAPLAQPDAAQAKGCVVLEITDHGIGIPAEHLDKIFDPYFSTSPNRSGLGLATAHSIVHQHGGDLRAVSKAGAGATFVLELPAATAPPPEQVTEVQGEGRPVLLMDDDEMVREVIASMLGNLGYAVALTSRGEEAIEAYTVALEAREPFAAVILDLSVAHGMGGAETIERLRAIDPDVRAVVCSGYSTSPVMARFREHGFRAVLPKPFELGELSEALHAAWRQD